MNINLLYFQLLLVVSMSLLNLQAQNTVAPSISISGATVCPTNPNYYLIEIPTNSSSYKIKVTARGGVPTLTTNDVCTNCSNTLSPLPTNNPKYTLSYAIGTQDQSNGPNITINLDSNTTPGAYDFQVTQVSQQYQDCPTNTSGGVSPNPLVNSLSSSNISLLIYKITSKTEFEAPDGTTNSRTTIGVGEMVDVTFLPASITPTWNAVNCLLTNTVANRATIIATNAGTGSASASVTATIQGLPVTRNFTCIAPTARVAGSATSIDSFGSYVITSITPGVLMKIDNISLDPKNVSFANISVSERSCPSTDESGYFKDHSLGYHEPNSESSMLTFKWIDVDNENNAGINTAGFILKYTPWTLSSSTTWKIPVCYVIRVINRPDSFFTIGYVNFATNNQVMEITSDGNCKVTKLGFSKTRPLATPAPTPRTP
jgi:hypothetical protein